MTRIRITSRDNHHLKEARKVRDGKIERSIFVEGLRLAEEAVNSGLSVEYCLVRDGFGSAEREDALLDALKERSTEILEADERSFASAVDTKTPQGVILICARPRNDRRTFEQRIQDDDSRLNLIVLLDEINNPSNLGAVVRTAEAAGAKGIILTKGSVDPFGTKAIRASMGSVFRLPMWSDVEVSEVVEFTKRTGTSLTAVSARQSVQYTAIDWRSPRVVAFGSEAHGLSSILESVAAEAVGIGMDIEVESLNLAVAAGIILFEARRQAAID